VFPKARNTRIKLPKEGWENDIQKKLKEGFLRKRGVRFELIMVKIRNLFLQRNS
jgi:hypothetical protein